MLESFFEHNAGALIAAIPATIFSVAAFLTSLDGMLNTRRNRRIAATGREVTDRKIESVREDLKNGVGTAIAVKAVEHIVPALAEVANVTAIGLKEVAREAASAAATELKEAAAEAANVAAAEVIQRAEGVASALAAQKYEAWDGVDRRVGATDRRTGVADRRSKEAP